MRGNQGRRHILKEIVRILQRPDQALHQGPGITVVDGGFGVLNQLVQHVDALHRVLPDRRFGGQGEPHRAIDDRVDDVVHLRPGRLLLLEHGFQQIGRHEHSGLASAGFVKDDFLGERDLLDRDFLAQIPPVDQQEVRLHDDLIQVLESIHALDFRDDLHSVLRGTPGFVDRLPGTDE